MPMNTNKELVIATGCCRSLHAERVLGGRHTLHDFEEDFQFEPEEEDVEPVFVVASTFPEVVDRTVAGAAPTPVTLVVARSFTTLIESFVVGNL